MPDRIACAARRACRASLFAPLRGQFARRAALGWVVGVALCGAPALPAAAQDYGGLVSHNDAARLGLARAWYTVAPVFDGARLTSIQLHDGLILAQNDRAGLAVIDAETGRTLWAKHVGHAAYPTYPAGAYGHLVAVTNGSTIYFFDRATGNSLGSYPMSEPPLGGCAVDDRYAYVVTARGGIEAYSVDEKLRAPGEPGHGRIFGGGGFPEASPLPVPGFICWGTDRGAIKISSTDDPNDIAQLDVSDILVRTMGRAKAPLAYRRYHVTDPEDETKTVPRDRLYAATSDGFVYSISLPHGDVVWQHPLGRHTTVLEQPLAAGDVVYVVTEEGQLIALDAAKGTARWYTTNVGQLLSASPTRLYVTDVYGQLGVIDPAGGAWLGMLPTAEFDVRLTNQDHDRVYLARHDGLIQCFREPDLAAPALHNAPPATADAAAPETPPADGTTPSDGAATP